MSAPTPGQLRVLKALHMEASAHGYPPSVREICTHLGLASSNAVAEHLEKLEAKGLIAHREGLARTVVITRRGLECLLEVAHVR